MDYFLCRLKSVSIQARRAEGSHDTRRQHGTLPLVLLRLRIDFPWSYICGKCHHGRRIWQSPSELPLKSNGSLLNISSLRNLRQENNI